MQDWRKDGLAGRGLLGKAVLWGLLAGVAVSGADGAAQATANDQLSLQTVMIDGQRISFALPPGFCLAPQDGVYGPLLYGAAARVRDTSPVTLKTLAVFLPCWQVRDPRMRPLVAYQSWAVATRHGSAIHLEPADTPARVLARMYERTRSAGYKRMEKAALHAMSRAFGGTIDVTRRQEISGLRPLYFYHLYRIPIQHHGTSGQICAATAFTVVHGLVLRSEQLGPCPDTLSGKAGARALVADVTGQIESFLAVNAQPAPQGGQ